MKKSETQNISTRFSFRVPFGIRPEKKGKREWIKTPREVGSISGIRTEKVLKGENRARSLLGRRSKLGAIWKKGRRGPSLERVSKDGGGEKRRQIGERRLGKEGIAGEIPSF